MEIWVLGRGASDHDIHHFAIQHGAVVVTNNHADFKRLANAGQGHPGMILLPSVALRDVMMLFAKVLPIADKIIDGAPNMFVEIDETGAVQSYRIP